MRNEELPCNEDKLLKNIKQSKCGTFSSRLDYPRLSSQQPQAALKQEARRDSLKLGSRRLPLKLETRGRSPRLNLGDAVPMLGRAATEQSHPSTKIRRIFHTPHTLSLKNT